MSGIYLAATFIGVNAALLAWSLVASWRLQRLIRQATALDNLLASICVQAYARQHQPIWQSWTAVMGTIEVEINQKRTLP